MKIRDCAAAAVLGLALASPASAAVKTITFDIAGDWTILDTGLPFTLTGSPVLHGSFSYDDATSEPYYFNSTAYRDIVAVDFSPGNQVWTLADVGAMTLVRTPTDFDPNPAFYLWFDNIFSPNSNHINLVQANQAFLYDGVNSAGCFENCVTWSVTDGLPDAGGGGVPEPVTWALMIAGFGMVGAMLRGGRTGLA